MPVILICVLMLVLWIRHHVNTSKNTILESREAFWKRESQANHTRNQSLESIEFLTVPIDQLPIVDTTVPELNTLQSDLIHLSTEKIANLSSYTNTELKLAYGTGNFSYLAQCDTNYTILLRTISRLADYHIHNGNKEAATKYLEYAVDCCSQNAKTYVSLVLLYVAQNNTPKIEELKSKILSSDYTNKHTLIRKIEQSYLDSIIIQD